MELIVWIIVGLAIAMYVTFVVAFTYSILTDHDIIDEFIEWLGSFG